MEGESKKFWRAIELVCHTVLAHPELHSEERVRECQEALEIIEKKNKEEVIEK